LADDSPSCRWVNENLGFLESPKKMGGFLSAFGDHEICMQKLRGGIE
jgi:hypothetical protein